MLDKLEEYKKHLKAFKKPPVMIQTFLNQKRYLEKYEVAKVDFNKKWISELCKERKYESHFIENIMTNVNMWESKNTLKDITP